MKILGLSIEGLRKIKLAQFDFSKGNLVEIRGANEAGKSTVLLAIEMLFGGKTAIPNDVITHGVERAEVVGQIGDYTIKRTITRGGSHVLKVEKDGMTKSSPQEFLNQLAGKFIDPQKFSELSGSEKKKKLMNYLNLDFSEIDKQIVEAEEQRRFTGREIKQIGQPVPVEKVDHVDAKSLIEEKEKIEGFNKDQKEAQEAIDKAYGKLDELKKHKEELEKQLQEVKERIEKGETYIENLPVPLEEKSTIDIDLKIENINETNEKAAKYKAYLEQKEKYEKKQNEYAEYTKQIEELRISKDEKLKSAKMPLDGLQITDNGLALDGINDENWSDSESLKVAMCISAALSSDLKTIFIKRGESLDQKSLEIVREFADKNNFQVIIEIVDDTYNKSGENIFYMEDGKIFESEEN